MPQSIEDSDNAPEEDSCDKSLRGSAAQFFVAGELCRRGCIAVVTLGNCPTTDILCSNVNGNRFAHIQVKTFRPGRRTCSVGLKAEKEYGDSFFWVLAGVPLATTSEQFVYYVIPADEMALHIKASHKIWSENPGAKGQARNANTSIRAVRLPPRECRDGWSVAKYENRWDLITARLQ